MRITAGRFKGRNLIPPKDMNVRPTSDKVRQAIFNILEHRDFGFPFRLEGTRAVDLFAGTGALGLEALSRGARYCLFVDDAALSRALIRQNVEALGQTGASKIWRRDAARLGALDTLSPFGLAFLDPPYCKDLIAPTLTGLRDGGWLVSPALVVVEMAEEEIYPSTDGFEVMDDRVYGDTRVVILRTAPRAGALCSYPCQRRKRPTSTWTKSSSSAG
jgi:16S rRNA (guanine966-N2)-methyltransferase